VEETHTQPQGKGHLIVPIILVATCVSIALTALLFILGDVVIVVPSKDYRTYNTVYWILLVALAVTSFGLAGRIPKDEGEVARKMPLILLCAILMIVLEAVLIWKGSVGSLADVSPFSDEVSVRVIADGLSLVCEFFGVYSFVLAVRIWRGRSYSWSKLV
jgi:hypothetical protein